MHIAPPQWSYIELSHYSSPEDFQDDFKPHSIVRPQVQEKSPDKRLAYTNLQDARSKSTPRKEQRISSPRGSSCTSNRGYSSRSDMESDEWIQQGQQGRHVRFKIHLKEVEFKTNKEQLIWMRKCTCPKQWDNQIPKQLFQNGIQVWASLNLNCSTQSTRIDDTKPKENWFHWMPYLDMDAVRRHCLFNYDRRTSTGDTMADKKQELSIKDSRNIQLRHCKVTTRSPFKISTSNWNCSIKCNKYLKRQGSIQLPSNTFKTPTITSRSLKIKRATQWCNQLGCQASDHFNPNISPTSSCWPWATVV